MATCIFIIALTGLVKVNILVLNELAQLLDLLAIQLHAHLVRRSDQVGMNLHVHIVFSLLVLFIISVLVDIITVAVPVVFCLAIALTHARILV